MAVSKRTRFEILRRDGYACRYCGQSAPDVKLTVDHVVPTSLGGTDDPTNLVACCSDCNAGKTSTSPDEHIVAQVADDAVRWAAAMRKATEIAEKKRADDDVVLAHFREHVWNQWTYGKDHDKTVPLPNGWESAILRQLDAGLTVADLEHAVKVAMTSIASDEFRYFMGVCKTMMIDRVKAAKELFDQPDGGSDG